MNVTHTLWPTSTHTWVTILTRVIAARHYICEDAHRECCSEKSHLFSMQVCEICLQQRGIYSRHCASPGTHHICMLSIYGLVWSSHHPALCYMIWFQAHCQNLYTFSFLVAFPGCMAIMSRGGIIPLNAIGVFMHRVPMALRGFYTNLSVSMFGDFLVY